MTTLIFKHNNFSATEFSNTQSFLITQIFYSGLRFDLPISFKKEIEQQNFKHNLVIAIKGNFKEDARPLRISLSDSEQVEMPNDDNWETFFVNYFLSNDIETIFLNAYPDGYTVSTSLENHYVWCDLSKDKLTIKKLEFGRYLPLEKPEFVRRSSSWTKAVFVNNQKDNIKFVQTSWDGEYGKCYQADFNSKNKDAIKNFLTIPFNIGWTEIDYRLDKKKYYKAAGQVIINGKEHTDVFTLLDIGEQDIPFFFADKVSQIIRTFWADSFINNFRRHIDKYQVRQIKTNANKSITENAG